MKKTFALIAVAGLAAIANAQTGTGSVVYQVSTDGGATWAGGNVQVQPSQASVLFRAVASWDGFNAVGFAGTQFDSVISNAGAGDAVANPTRPGTTSGGSAQTLVATRFGTQIKIDDSRDTAAPGAGARGVFPGQLAQQFAGTNFSSANPLVIFQFQLNLDGTEGTRSVNNLYIAPSGGDTVSRYMRVYTSGTGAQNTPTSTTTGASVEVIPSPGALALLGMGLAAAGRRRR